MASDGRRLLWMSGLVVALVGAAWYVAVVGLGAVSVLPVASRFGPDTVTGSSRFIHPRGSRCTLER
jgi:hypothetical protein